MTGITKQNSETSSEEEEETYEVENVINHRMTDEGELEYLLKWKGYGSDENSWCDEEDTMCQELIRLYWNARGETPPPGTSAARLMQSLKKSPTPQTQPRNKSSSPQKDISPTPKLTEAPTKPIFASLVEKPISSGERSIGYNSIPIIPEKSPKFASIKRNRQDSSELESMDEDELAVKTRKRTSKPAPKPEEKKKTRGRQKAKTSASELEPDDLYKMSERELAGKSSWEDVIASIDTMEKRNDELFVFCTLKNSKNLCVSTSVAYKYFPLKMLNFYENHLRFKS